MQQPTRDDIILLVGRTMVGAVNASDRGRRFVVPGRSPTFSYIFRPYSGKESALREGLIDRGSLTGVGRVHGSGGRRVRWLMLLRWLRRYPEGCEQRPGHCTGGGCRWRRALLADEQARGREPEELGSLEPRPIVACQVWSLRRDLDRDRDAGRYHAWKPPFKRVLV